LVQAPGHDESVWARIQEHPNTFLPVTGQ
jgi:hypothetical protein